MPLERRLQCQIFDFWVLIEPGKTGACCSARRSCFRHGPRTRQAMTRHATTTCSDTGNELRRRTKPDAGYCARRVVAVKVRRATAVLFESAAGGQPKSRRLVRHNNRGAGADRRLDAEVGREVGSAANQLALLDEADIGDQHVAVDIVAIAIAAGEAWIDTDADGDAAAKTPMRLRIPTTATAGRLENGQRTGGSGRSRGNRGGGCEGEHNLL